MYLVPAQNTNGGVAHGVAKTATFECTRDNANANTIAFVAKTILRSGAVAEKSILRFQA